MYSDVILLFPLFLLLFRCVLLKAVPGEVVCEGCQEKVLEAVGRMIQVMDEQTVPGDTTAVDTGRNILHVIGTDQSQALIEWDSSSEITLY